MKVQFEMNNRVYLSPSSKEAISFLRFWNDIDEYYNGVRRIQTNWKFQTIERGPGYAFRKVDLPKIEYS